MKPLLFLKPIKQIRDYPKIISNYQPSIRLKCFNPRHRVFRILTQQFINANPYKSVALPEYFA